MQARYSAYRARQARELVSLLPQEAIRPLYRRAVRALPNPGDPVGDPLSILVTYCEELLPLPPFGVWMDDVTRHPTAYLDDLNDSAAAPTASAPETLEGRVLEYRGEPWVAHLRGFRDRDAWRGFIAFEDDASRSVHRTALIFREAGPAELRSRFLSFESIALEAFLRSALP